jgi:hypothetical protein
MNAGFAVYELFVTESVSRNRWFINVAQKKASQDGSSWPAIPSDYYNLNLLRMPRSTTGRRVEVERVEQVV